MKQCNNTAQAETDIAETDTNVQQHTCNGNYHCQNGIRLHFITDSGADGLILNHGLIQIEFGSQLILQLGSLLHT